MADMVREKKKKIKGGKNEKEQLSGARKRAGGIAR